MVDHSMNPEFSGASYGSCDFLIKARIFLFIFSQRLNLITSPLYLSFYFCDLTKEPNIYTISNRLLNYFSLLFSYLEREVAGFNPI